MSPPKSFDHPSFGPCELVPAIVAIKWSRPQSPEEACDLVQLQLGAGF